MKALALVLVAGCIPELTTSGEKKSWEYPTNRWEQGEGCDTKGFESKGFNEGDVIPDFRLPDQHGDDVSLWQFCGMVVLVDISTMWCGPCRQLAPSVMETYEDYRGMGRDFMYVTVLPENEKFEVPSEEELNEWADLYSIDLPVLRDTDRYAYDAEPNSGWPALILIDTDMTMAVERVTPPTDEAIRAAIDKLFDPDR